MPMSPGDSDPAAAAMAGPARNPATARQSHDPRLDQCRSPRGLLGFLLGRQIINSYQELHRRGESRICFLRIDLEPVIRTYLVGTSIWRARRSMESGSATAIRR